MIMEKSSMRQLLDGWDRQLTWLIIYLLLCIFPMVNLPEALKSQISCSGMMEMAIDTSSGLMIHSVS
jgi:hypothetical protein